MVSHVLIGNEGVEGPIPPGFIRSDQIAARSFLKIWSSGKRQTFRFLADNRNGWRLRLNVNIIGLRVACIMMTVFRQLSKY